MDAISPKIVPDRPAAALARGVLGASGWHSGNGADARLSLSEVNSTIPIPIGGHWFRRLLAFAGPGYMGSGGYIDPGHWGTHLAGGAQLCYTPLSVVRLSNVVAVLLPALSPPLRPVTRPLLCQSCHPP